MLFDQAAPISKKVSGVSVYNPSSQAVVEYNGSIYVFYNGSGNDGIWYFSFDGSTWSKTASIAVQIPGMGVAPGTSPAAVVYNGIIYLFYNGSGNDGTFYTTFNGQNWSARKSVKAMIGEMGFLPKTSPSAAVFNGAIYLFWNGSGNDGIWYSIFGGANWTSQVCVKTSAPGMNVADNTSPSVVVFKQQLYLFFNGAGKDGTWYCTLGSKWVGPISVAKQIGAMSFLANSSPSATVFDSADSICLGWTGSGNDGSFYSMFNGARWTSQVSLSAAVGGQNLLSTSNVAFGSLESQPYLFWSASDKGIWFTQEMLYDLSSVDVNTVLQQITAGNAFGFYSSDPEVQAKLNQSFSTLPNPAWVPALEGTSDGRRLQQQQLGQGVIDLVQSIGPSNLYSLLSTVCVTLGTIVIVALLRNYRVELRRPAPNRGGIRFRVYRG